MLGSHCSPTRVSIPFLCLPLPYSLCVCFSVCAEGGSSGGEGGGKAPDMNVSANLMLATTLLGAVFVYQVGVCVRAAGSHSDSNRGRTFPV